MASTILNRTHFRVGTRKSRLAIIQTDTVINKLLNNSSNHVTFEKIAMSTTGDKVLDQPLSSIGSKSLFTKELEVGLLKGELDFVVHSLKDLPTTLPDGCCIGAVIRRDNPNDVVILKKSLCDSISALDLIFGRNNVLKKAFRVGTSSPRRVAMVRNCNPSVDCLDMRGNLNTRLTKLDSDDNTYDAMILAKAGLDRMKWSDRESLILSPETDQNLAVWHYAVGQGAIAVECRQDDAQVLELLSSIIDISTTLEVTAERCLMKKLEGGCSVPLGVRSRWSGDSLQLKCILLSVDGQIIASACQEADINGGLDHSVEDTANTMFPSCLAGVSNLRRQLSVCAQLGIDVANEIRLSCVN